MNRLLKNNLLLIMCLSIFGCVSSSGLMTHEELKEVTLKDGIYEGEYKKSIYGAETVVTVEEGKIKEIEVPKCKIFPLKRKSKKKLKEIPGEVIEKQSIKVDVVSGATNSSYALMQAIQNAVSKAIVAESE